MVDWQIIEVSSKPALTVLALFVAVLVLGAGCANQGQPAPTPTPDLTRYHLADTNNPVRREHIEPFAPLLTAKGKAEQNILWIYEAIDRAAKQSRNMQYQAPTNAEVWQGCLALLVELHGLPPRDWGVTQRGLNVANIIAEVAGVNWTDFCRVLNGAGGDWERIGTGKWDAAIPKYGLSN